MLEKNQVFTKRVRELLEAGEIKRAIALMGLGMKYYSAKTKNQPLPPELVAAGLEDKWHPISMDDIWGLLECHSMIQLEVYGPIPDGCYKEKK